ncbi:hypothetical protein [Algisphaera agarilytica]|uniref:HNH endonuclease n=1 Tax=Algisphaera agarilytica TaxID=1385975 RepID=A0A7X0LM12_9BACT|nr:hypothetical protein [Algisphaera agarilytica]MBB6430533.1 hypothetical protein [Algisphaera agarilytica]
MPEPNCELCGRSGLELTRHHLVPRARHNKPRTKRMHPRINLNTYVAMICRPCHATVHHHLSEQELAEAYHTLEALRGHPEIAKFARWVAKQPVDRRVTTRRPTSRR